MTRGGVEWRKMLAMLGEWKYRKLVLINLFFHKQGKRLRALVFISISIDRYTKAMFCDRDILFGVASFNWRQYWWAMLEWREQVVRLSPHFGTNCCRRSYTIWMEMKWKFAVKYEARFFARKCFVGYGWLLAWTFSKFQWEGTSAITSGRTIHSSGREPCITKLYSKRRCEHYV